jgi:pimeloyl-ACP methyl ester carboxylesterase
MLTCSDWPAAESAPVTSTVASGSNPILVVSTVKDPATPYQWGPLVAGQLANARLLTYDGTGHTAYTQGSTCVDDAVDAYLLRGELPDEGARCP